ncbi:unnamed protein product [Mytilus edulis]|uniref:IPT/TIG domain-containing protein n=1 Tax=Mytilus edulis TaxID=6550 RepID=A0A8S3TXW7_MYTED|nr:unnamed protein product [Mytilus edulis]
MSSERLIEVLISIAAARRMDGFKVYVTNTPNVPPVGHLCYEDPDPGLPNITQTIACNHLGQFVIYYDTKGSDEGQTVPDLLLSYVTLQFMVHPSSGPVNGGTLLTITGTYIGNVNDNINVDVSGEAMISEFSPKKGVVSGGTTVVIQGSDLEFEGIHRYSISFCSIDTCIQCSGGATFTIHGDGFNNVGNIIVERVVKPCDVPGDTSAVCETPPKMQNQSNDQTVHVHFDGFILPINIVFVDDPTFEKFSGVLEYDHEYSIQIKGTNILNGARREDYGVQIGLDGTCFISDINMQFIRCFPPKSVPRTNKSDENTVHVITCLKGGKSRNDNEVGHYEESETPYSEINPGAELNSSSSSVGHQDVNTGYEELGHRSPRPTNPYNHLQQSKTDNQMPDTTNIDNRTKGLLARDYMNLKI